jgi:transcriptional regulator with XRE-family HTH domain
MVMYTKGMTFRQLLRQHGITRSSELAKRVGISRQQAYQLWQGKRALSRAMIYRVSEATGIAPADLFLAERPMPRPQLKGRPPKRRTGEATP